MLLCCRCRILPELSYSGYRWHAYTWDDYPPLKNILDAVRMLIHCFLFKSPYLLLPLIMLICVSMAYFIISSLCLVLLQLLPFNSLVRWHKSITIFNTSSIYFTCLPDSLGFLPKDLNFHKPNSVFRFVMMRFQNVTKIWNIQACLITIFDEHKSICELLKNKKLFF